LLEGIIRIEILPRSLDVAGADPVSAPLDGTILIVFEKVSNRVRWSENSELGADVKMIGVAIENLHGHPVP
jgi:hypothetical protein